MAVGPVHIRHGGHHFRSYRLRSQMAKPFIMKMMASSTSEAAAVSPRIGSWLAGPREDHDRDGGEGPPQPLHVEASPTFRKPVTAPTRISGAASPAARASEITVPVRMPGAADGSTWLRTVSQRVAPTAERALPDALGNGAERFGGRDHDDREHEDGQREPSRDDTSTASEPAVAVVAEPFHEHGQAEDAVDDRGHASEVADVDLRESSEPRLAGVLLEVDGAGDAEREGDQGHDDADPRACPRWRPTGQHLRRRGTARSVRKLPSRSVSTAASVHPHVDARGRPG